ncbi:hypothetical protein G6O69_36640 [Pseudenhygromyxa sp. WMMC2535]|uniref:hypothetical protein n=1 Tax=Pseudenhygromyxa sp. WMMC2535 TaxID=2712867 RepID=UPI001557F3F6|nr:hypothetical protein [Pseudenhygromyxa sp. WMMC2535]NVB36212.1 hypothetical protein [Pseudenhygromyxa sp. WMMC2535]NVB43411.1 hypothetical protein [Pseudenhygromyxa sp. WMMC2535]
MRRSLLALAPVLTVLASSSCAKDEGAASVEQVEPRVAEAAPSPTAEAGEGSPALEELPPTAAQERARVAATIEGEQAVEGAATAGGVVTDTPDTPDTSDASEAEEGDGSVEVAAAGEADSRSDPLAPELPSGPAPGTPEADAELLALLDESTLTQDEFDAGFKAGVGVDGDALSFGAGDRTRKRPKVSVGTPEIRGAKAATAVALRELAEADLRGLETCHAMALSKDASQLGRATLGLRFDASGKVTEVDVGGAEVLGEALRACLASVAEGWTLAAAAGATAQLPLSLSAQ